MPWRMVDHLQGRDRHGQCTTARLQGDPSSPPVPRWVRTCISPAHTWGGDGMTKTYIPNIPEVRSSPGCLPEGPPADDDRRCGPHNGAAASADCPRRRAARRGETPEVIERSPHVTRASRCSQAKTPTVQGGRHREDLSRARWPLLLLRKTVGTRVGGVASRSTTPSPGAEVGRTPPTTSA